MPARCSLAISDVVAIGDLPATLAADPAAYTGCIAGAAPVAELERTIAAAGFTDVRVAVQPSSRATTQVEVPWEELYGNLRGFVGRRVSNPADVDDLVQAIMVRLLKGLGTLRDSERLHPWVYRTARNVIIDHYRAAASRREVTAAADGRDDEASSHPIAGENEDVALQELAECLAPMLRRLHPPYQEAVTLTELRGVTQAEAAKRAGISFSGMKSRVQRARKRLRTVLEECCRIQLDRRGGIIGYEPRHPESCHCRTCSSEAEPHEQGRIHVHSFRHAIVEL